VVVFRQTFRFLPCCAAREPIGPGRRILVLGGDRGDITLQQVAVS